MSQADDSLRKHVLYLLRGGGAHQSFDDFVNGFPPDLCGRKIEGLPYSNTEGPPMTDGRVTDTER